MSRAIVDTFAGVDGRGCPLTKCQPISKTTRWGNSRATIESGSNSS